MILLVIGHHMWPLLCPHAVAAMWELTLSLGSHSPAASNGKVADDIAVSPANMYAIGGCGLVGTQLLDQRTPALITQLNRLASVLECNLQVSKAKLCKQSVINQVEVKNNLFLGITLPPSPRLLWFGLGSFLCFYSSNYSLEPRNELFSFNGLKYWNP